MGILISGFTTKKPVEYINKKGTAERRCNCGSWKQHWINVSGKKWPDKCMVKGCYAQATLGAHITKVGESKEYIVPACESCNQSSSEFQLKQDDCLVSANQSETCRKNR
ncbi:MAG: hypothetical protein E7506_06250 [Ruminococcus sp.]|nr:hypothetical protein [Ruminococcus sp.]